MILISCLLLNVVASLYGSTLSSRLHIDEHGEVYDQNIDYDPMTKAITLHVPAHHDILEKTVIIHAESNTEVALHTLEGTCFVSNAPKDFHPEEFLVYSMNKDADYSTTTPAEAKIVYQLTKTLGPVSEEDRFNMIPAIQKLCEGLPMERIVAIPVSEEEFLARTVRPANSTFQPTRFKRQSMGSDWFICSDLSDRCTMSTGTYCQWYTVNRRGASEVELEHIRSGTWACVSCCNDGYTDMCTCNEITSQSSFNRCQGDQLARL